MLRSPEDSSARSRVAEPMGLRATARNATANSAAYRARPTAPQRSRLVARILSKSPRAGAETRNRAIPLACSLAPWPVYARRAELGEIAFDLALVDLGGVAALESRNPQLDLR